MGQTNIFRLCQSRRKLMLFVMLLAFCCITSIILADIPPQNIAVDTTFVGASSGNNRLNARGAISLQVSWQGDSPPFTAKYKKGGNTILSDSSITSNSTSAQVSAISWGDTNGSPETITVEIVDAGGRSNSMTSQAFIVDTQAPTITASIVNGVNGNNFSQTSSVRIQINSNENITKPTVTCGGKSATLEGADTPGTSFVFNLQLDNSFPKGKNTVLVEGCDTSEPAPGNQGSTSVDFYIGTTSSGDTKIDSSNPASPTNAQNVVLSGSAPDGTKTIKLYDNGSELTSFAINSTNWTYNFQPEAKDYSLVAASIDALGQELSRSSAFPLVIDREAPNTPSFTSEGILFL